MMKLVACVAVAALLAACGQVANTEPPPATSVAVEEPVAAVPTNASAGPSGADNMTWQFTPANSSTAGTSNPRLMYASYGSEGMALNLQCERQTVYARLARDQQRENWPFTLLSGAARVDLTGTGEGESEVIVTASAPIASPAFAAFRDSGDLTLIEDGRTQVLDAINDQERHAIGSFFQACS